MPKRYTQADVARLAGVSQAMISYVVNNNPNITIPDETRQRILDVMKEVGYIPNALARGLRSGRTRTIGLVVPDNANPFFAEIAQIIERMGYENGYSVILCNSDYDDEKETAYVDVLLAKEADGVIFISSGGSGEASQKLVDSRTPFVIVGHDISGSENDFFMIDYQTGGYLATKHLLDLGHRRIACITGPQQFSYRDQRLDGYRQAFAEAGLDVDETLIVGGDFRTQGGEEAMRRLLQLNEPPTAVFACNDLMAIGAVHVIRQHGLQIPRDFSVIGYDDISFAQMVDPPLTTIAQPIPVITENAMNLLLQRMDSQVDSSDGGAGRKQATIQPRLVIRQSTAAYREQA